jgi:adenine-specific DNA-methyltransferase
MSPHSPNYNSEEMMKKIVANDPETRSTDVVAENIALLNELFPELVTENVDGASINLDTLKQLVGDQTITDVEEKYGLNWHGKRQARQIALSPSIGTLRPCPGESVEWDTTQNLMIEGDNLEVLKLLQKSYTGKVKLIYIDPPYNTGKDFVYMDDFQDNIHNYLELTGHMKSGRKLSSNTEASGRFHTDWLNMMYPRLRLARDLLRSDGLLFVSIDDNEVDSVRKICTEIFGEENFVAEFVWNTEGHTDNQFDVKVNHEYVLLYSRDARKSSLGHVVDPNTRLESNLWKGYAENSITKNGPANPPSEIELPNNFPCQVDELDLPASKPPVSYFDELDSHGYITREMSERFQVTYPIRLDSLVVKNGRLSGSCRVFSGWANANKLKAFIANKCSPIEDNGDKLSFYLSEKGVIYYRRDREKARNILSVLRNLGTTEKMRSELEAMGIPFDYPKPKELLRYLVQIGCEGEGIVLDYFAGSGTLAHSVWLQQVADNVSRRLILVQFPEPLDPDNEKHRRAIQFCDQLNRPRNIAEIAKERLRRTATRVKDENPMFAGDLGFRVFKLDSTNIKEWQPQSANLPQTLEESVQHLKTDRKEEDILYELLLKLGLDLCVPIEKREIAGKEIHAVGGGVLIVCLAEEISSSETDALSQGIVKWYQELDPAGDTTCVFRDSAFVDDVTKTNIAAILDQNGIANIRSL